MIAAALARRRDDGDGLRGESWLARLASWPGRAAPPEQPWARAAALAGPALASRLPVFAERQGAWVRDAVEAALLASSFELTEVDRRAARIQAHLEAGELPEARAELDALAPYVALDPELDVADGPAIVGATIAALARRPQSYLAVWLSYALFGPRAAVALAARPAWQAALGWAGPLRRWTAARPDPVVRVVGDRAAAAATALAAPAVSGSFLRTVGALRDDDAPLELAAMAAALDRSLTVEGMVVNAGAPPAGPGDIRRARRLAWAACAALAAGTLGLLVALPAGASVASRLRGLV